jgi:hypothetical protein
MMLLVVSLIISPIIYAETTTTTNATTEATVAKPLANIKISGDMSEKLAPELAEQKSIWSLTLNTDPKKLLSWFVKVDCEVSLQSAEQHPQLAVIFNQAEERVQDEYQLEPAKLLKFSVGAESSKPTLDITFRWSALDTKTKIDYQCHVADLKFMTGSGSENTDAATLNILLQAPAAPVSHGLLFDETFYSA